MRDPDTGKRWGVAEYIAEIASLEAQIAALRGKINAATREARMDGYDARALNIVAKNKNKGEDLWRAVAQYLNASTGENHEQR